MIPVEAMEVEETSVMMTESIRPVTTPEVDENDAPTTDTKGNDDDADAEEEEEEDTSDLQILLETAEDESSDLSDQGRMEILNKVLTDPSERFGSKASSIKERAVYALTRVTCRIHTPLEVSGGKSTVGKAVVDLLSGSTCSPFFTKSTGARCARVVRAVLDVVSTCVPNDLPAQAAACRGVIEWCRGQGTGAPPRTFLRHRVESKLASVLLDMEDHPSALAVVDPLLVELKRLDDKQLLAEVHLVECGIHHGLRGTRKARAALTSSRTCANAIYVPPALQARIDTMSGVLHCEEGDYNTAHSYFLEAFEQLDQRSDDKGVRERAMPCLKYMMLCRILEGLSNALNLGSKGGIGAKVDKSELLVTSAISAKSAVKYAGPDIEAMTAIGHAATSRSLSQYETVLSKYPQQLQDDTLVRHHLDALRTRLLESNLMRIVEPYSVVEIEHVANLMGMPTADVDRHLSRMILDGRFRGTLDQGRGRLLVHEDGGADKAIENGLGVIKNMDDIVTSLFSRCRGLRAM